MNRRSFLKRSGALAGALAVAPRVTLEGLAGDGSPAAVSMLPYAGDSLTASGGLCAPLTPYYPLEWVATGRPVRDALPRFSVAR